MRGTRIGPATIAVSVVVVLVVGAFIAVLAVSTFTGRMFETPEQRAVRAWLDDNGGDSMKVVKWFPAIDSSNLLVAIDAGCYDWRKLRPGKYVSLSVRQRFAGGTVVQNLGFVVHNGIVIPVDADKIRNKSESREAWMNRTNPSPWTN